MNSGLAFKDDGYPNQRLLKPTITQTSEKLAMFKTLEALDTQQHAQLCYRGVDSYAFAQQVSWAPLACSEIIQAAREMPVMFTTGEHVRPVALMGLRRDTNALVSRDGRWKGRYIPAHLRRYPFVLGATGKADEFVVMIDRAAPHFSLADEQVESALAMFEDGQPVPEGIVEQARTFLLDFYHELEQSERWLAPLKEHDVLVERQLTLTRDGKKEVAVNGFAMVDVARLNALDDATLAAWARNGLLGLVFAHLHSQTNSNGLIHALETQQANAAAALATTES